MSKDSKIDPEHMKNQLKPHLEAFKEEELAIRFKEVCGYNLVARFYYRDSQKTRLVYVDENGEKHEVIC